MDKPTNDVFLELVWTGFLPFATTKAITNVLSYVVLFSFVYISSSSPACEERYNLIHHRFPGAKDSICSCLYFDYLVSASTIKPFKTEEEKGSFWPSVFQIKGILVQFWTFHSAIFLSYLHWSNLYHWNEKRSPGNNQTSRNEDKWPGANVWAILKLSSLYMGLWQFTDFQLRVPYFVF